jgi:serine/threonine protein kinase
MTPERWRQIEELYHSARERGPEEREALLARATAEVRGKVEALLAQDASGDKILDRPAAELLEESTVTDLGAGAQFGPYRIVSRLGAGGMGEVYRAHDTKLGRDVAIKTLPIEFAQDPDRLVRFRREARVLASLNHPNIAAIYGLEKTGDVDCLVLELVEGETLRGPLPLNTALSYACQIADALEAAHSACAVASCWPSIVSPAVTTKAGSSTAASCQTCS